MNPTEFPPLADWLVERVNEYSDNELPGQRPACLISSQLLTNHICTWLDGFSFRFHCHKNTQALVQLGGSIQENSQKEIQRIEDVLTKIMAGMKRLAEVQKQKPIDAFYSLFVINPEGTMRFMAEITRCWYLTPAALKFGLVGGFDGVDAVEMFRPKNASYVGYVKMFIEKDTPPERALLMGIKEGEVTEAQVKSARRVLGRLDRNYFWQLLKTPAYTIGTGSLNQHKSERGKSSSVNKGKPKRG